MGILVVGLELKATTLIRYFNEVT